MRHITTTTAGLLMLSAVGAVAGGLERNSQSVGLLFEKGKYAELTFSYVSPSVSGTFGATPSGDMAGGYSNFSLGYKQSLTDNIDVAVILDQPYGANVAYPTGTGYPFQGATAEVSSHSITGLLRYKMASNISVIGGVRAHQVSGVVSIPIYGYQMSTNRDLEVGYVLGVAWEKPEIAARIALTYNSAITHEFAATESTIGASTFSSEFPQSLNLEFQTGIAAGTLLFGSIRWVEWSAFDISPTGFPAGSLVNYTNDIMTYNLGVGRKFNDNWAGAVTLGYEKTLGDPVGNLGPTDGYKSIGLATTYTSGNMKVTAGVRYVDIGDATTTTIGANFADNSAWGAGIRVGFSF